MNTIALNRLKYLFREYFVTHWKRDLLIFGGIFLAKVLLLPSGSVFPEAFIVVVMSIILANIFKSLYKGSQGMNYLLCPANTEEKVIVNIVLVHVYYTAILVLACVLGHFIATQLYLSMPNYNILSPLISGTIKLLNYQFYAVLFAFQSIFIFTSIYFKKNSALKTILFFVCFVIMLMLVIKFTGIGKIMIDIDTLPSGAFVSYNEINGQYMTDLASYIINKYANMTITYCVITVFFWVLSYLRLRETEV